MDTSTLEKGNDKTSSPANHKILTHLWGYDSRKPWDEECWIIFHNLIILLSMRSFITKQELALKIFSYTGGIISILEKKSMEGKEILTDSASVMNVFMKLAEWGLETDSSNTDRGVISIVKALKKHRDKLVSEVDDAFAYILTQTKLEVDEPYYEAELHEACNHILETTKKMLPDHYVQNLQLEMPRETKGADVQNLLFEYFKKKGFTTEEHQMLTGSVYDNEKLIYNTSITAECGERNIVVMITLTSLY